MDHLGNAARVNMIEKILDYIARVRDDVGHDLLLFAVHKKLNDLAEVASQNRVDKFNTISFDEFEKAVKQHVLVNYLILVVRSCGHCRRLLCRALSRLLGLILRLMVESRGG